MYPIDINVEKVPSMNETPVLLLVLLAFAHSNWIGGLNERDPLLMRSDLEAVSITLTKRNRCCVMTTLGRRSQITDCILVIILHRIYSGPTLLERTRFRNLLIHTCSLRWRRLICRNDKGCKFWDVLETFSRSEPDLSKRMNFWIWRLGTWRDNSSCSYPFCLHKNY